MAIQRIGRLRTEAHDFQFMRIPRDEGRLDERRGRASS